MLNALMMTAIKILENFMANEVSTSSLGLGGHGVPRIGKQGVAIMGGHGVQRMGMGEHGIPRMGEYKVPRIGERGVPRVSTNT